MSKEQYDSRGNIEETRNRINNILEKINNWVYVFDFGHYINKDLKKNSYYFKTVIFGSESYKNKLFPNNKVNSKKDAYTFFGSSLKQIINIPASYNQSSIDKDISDVAFTLGPETISTNIEFNTFDFVNVVQELEINGCIFIYAKKVGNYQSGVWLILNNRLDFIKDDLICFGFKNNCINCCEKKEDRICIYNADNKYFLNNDILKSTIDEVFNELDYLLVNELVYNAEEYAKEIEAERLAYAKFRDEIIEVHAHTVKNCFPDIGNMKNAIKKLLSDREFNKIERIIEEERIANEELIHIIKRITKTNTERSYNVIEILEFLKNHVKPSESSIVPTCFEGLDNINNFCKLSSDQEDIAFTLLWNLWKNCKNACKFKSPFRVKLHENLGDELVVSFINDSPNDEHTQNVLEILNSSELPEKNLKGLNIIRYKANELGWILDAEFSDNKLIIELTTKNIFR